MFQASFQNELTEALAIIERPDGAKQRGEAPHHQTEWKEAPLVFIARFRFLTKTASSIRLLLLRLPRTISVGRSLQNLQRWQIKEENVRGLLPTRSRSSRVHSCSDDGAKFPNRSSILPWLSNAICERNWTEILPLAKLLRLTSRIDKTATLKQRNSCIGRGELNTRRLADVTQGSISLNLDAHGGWISFLGLRLALAWQSNSLTPGRET